MRRLYQFKVGAFLIEQAKLTLLHLINHYI